MLNKNENITKPSLPVSNSGGGGINDIKGFNIMVNTNLGKNDTTNDLKNEKIRDTSKNEKIRDIANYRDSDLDLSRNNYSNYNNDDDDDYDDDVDEDYDNKTCSKNVWRKLKQL